MIIVARQSNIEEAYSLGARNVLRVIRFADQIAHRPLKLLSDDMSKWKSDVAFIGTWMPERGPFLERLIELNVPLSIRGDRWHRAKEWKSLKRAWRGPGVLGQDYVKAVQGAKVCLGLLSKGNRDSHTTRSAEIPSIGSVLCAERTEEHLAMYHEDKEALFWSTAEECAEKCLWLLQHPKQREQIAKAGQKRCRINGYLNETSMAAILKNVLGRKPATSLQIALKARKNNAQSN